MQHMNSPHERPELRGHVKGPRPETVEKIERIKAMQAEGRSLSSIARELGVSKQRVHQIVSREEDGKIYRGDANNRVKLAAYHRRKEAS